MLDVELLDEPLLWSRACLATAIHRMFSPDLAFCRVLCPNYLASLSSLSDDGTVAARCLGWTLPGRFADRAFIHQGWVTCSLCYRKDQAPDGIWVSILLPTYGITKRTTVQVGIQVRTISGCPLGQV